MMNRAGITVVVTNHVTHWRGYPAPALGVFWAQQIPNCFFVEKRDKNSEVRRISTVTADNEEALTGEFRIGARGLEDVEE
uniref:DNA recombination and repair protein Rad51-like C-terminal domain-containing protein n=2 Tax=Caenorhabditis japonica TaxID=281687 RepID=A0A8R1IW43_CAEJA